MSLSRSEYVISIRMLRPKLGADLSKVDVLPALRDAALRVLVRAVVPALASPAQFGRDYGAAVGALEELIGVPPAAWPLLRPRARARLARAAAALRAETATFERNFFFREKKSLDGTPREE